MGDLVHRQSLACNAGLRRRLIRGRRKLDARVASLSEVEQGIALTGQKQPRRAVIFGVTVA